MNEIDQPQETDQPDAGDEDSMPSAEQASEAEASAGSKPSSQPEAPEPVPEPVEIDPQHLRLLEAILFSSPEPLGEAAIAERMPDGAPVAALLAELGNIYQDRGVNLAMAGGAWFFRTAEDLSEQLRVFMQVPKRLSRAAMETLAIVAYHQPITRAEVEEIRGVSLSKGTLDALMEQGWIGPRGRRRTAGRPVTWGTTQQFLTTFGLAAIADLPGLDDLKAAGLLDKRPSIQITDLQEDEEEAGEEPLDEEMLLDMDLPEDGPARAGSPSDEDEGADGGPDDDSVPDKTGS